MTQRNLPHQRQHDLRDADERAAETSKAQAERAAVAAALVHDLNLSRALDLVEKMWDHADDSTRRAMATRAVELVFTNAHSSSWEIRGEVVRMIAPLVFEELRKPDCELRKQIVGAFVDEALKTLKDDSMRTREMLERVLGELAQNALTRLARQRTLQRLGGKKKP